MTAARRAVELLQTLVRIPSVSGAEEDCRDALAAWLEQHGVPARVHGRNVLATVTGARPGRGLLLCSHIDVVPVGPGWTQDPWSGDLVDGRILGRGSNDAKSSVAAMAAAAASLDPSTFAGRLELAFVCDEETGGEGIEACVDDLPPVDACIVGEPTGLDACPGQRGMVKARVTCAGRSCHASRPWEGDNALRGIARDLQAVFDLDLDDDDPLLGRPTLEPTLVDGGTRSNVLPGEGTFVVDGRPTPGFDNTRMLAALRDAVGGEVTVLSERYVPVRTPAEHEIVVLARAASPTGRVRGFGGVSDLFHLRHVPGLIMGPGTSEASHAPDEWVAVDQVTAAADTYGTIAREFFAARAGVGERHGPGDTPSAGTGQAGGQP